jgi:NAD(P)H-hydrate repair Nnr-like enzyme with NAD(P)H-hydrate dehydratase domain
VKDNSLAVLTPNKMEYKRLVEKILNSDVNEDNPSEQLRLLSQKYFFFLAVFLLYSERSLFSRFND